MNRELLNDRLCARGLDDRLEDILSWRLRKRPRKEGAHVEFMRQLL